MSQFNHVVACFLLFGVSNSYAQTTDVLKLKNKPNYHEQNMLTIDSLIRLQQRVWYDEPRIIDEEFWIIFDIVFLDSLKALKVKNIDIEKDSSIVKCTFNQYSVWLRPAANNSVSGTITILEWSADMVKVRFDVTAKPESGNSKDIYLYSGERAFVKGIKWTGR